MDAEVAGTASDGCRTVGKANLNTLLLHALLDRLGSFKIKAPQQMIAAHQLGHGHAKAIEDAGEFTGDEASTHHHKALR